MLTICVALHNGLIAMGDRPTKTTTQRTTNAKVDWHRNDMSPCATSHICRVIARSVIYYETRKPRFDRAANHHADRKLFIEGRDNDET
jgi:hypothetical protein